MNPSKSAGKKAAWLLVWLLAGHTIHSLAGDPFASEAVAMTPAVPVPTNAATPPWGRVVLVGASATAGFTLSEPFGGTNTPQYRLTRYVEAALLAPHEPVRNLATTMFFMQPETNGQQQVIKALTLRPTLVLGADFMFWFCYGKGPTDEDRQHRFEQGLKLLEAIECPLVLGDIPDASAAANGILGPDQIPSAAALAAANRRLREWAATRPQVAILSLSAFMQATMANASLTIHGQTLPAGETRALLQEDKLHPSARGAAVLALALLDTFQATQPRLATNEVCWDDKEVYRLGSSRTLKKPAKPAEAIVPAATAEK